MERKRLLSLLLVGALASIAISTLAVPSATYSWEKTFEVQNPEVQCEIKIGECRIVGYPVNIWVKLKLAGCLKLDCCGRNDDSDCHRKDCRNCTNLVPYHLNGTYAAQLHWWNETSQEWQHVVHLETGKNITLTCEKHVETYMFTPMWTGKYKVVVTFTTSDGTSTFENGD